jgi:hypothetical protein
MQCTNSIGMQLYFHIDVVLLSPQYEVAGFLKLGSAQLRNIPDPEATVEEDQHCRLDALANRWSISDSEKPRISSQAARSFSTSSRVNGSVAASSTLGGLSALAGLSEIHFRLTQKAQKARRYSISFLCVRGATVRLSRRAETRSMSSGVTARGPANVESCFNERV